MARRSATRQTQAQTPVQPTTNPGLPRLQGPMQGMTSSLRGLRPMNQAVEAAKPKTQAPVAPAPKPVPDPAVIQQRQENIAFASRLDNLDEKFHEKRSVQRKGKRVSMDVIDDGRITPSERLKLFVEAAVSQGYDPREAVEFGLKRMEQGPPSIEARPAIQQPVKVNVNFEELLTKK